MALCIHVCEWFDVRIHVCWLKLIPPPVAPTSFQIYLFFVAWVAYYLVPVVLVQPAVRVLQVVLVELVMLVTISTSKTT